MVLSWMLSGPSCPTKEYRSRCDSFFFQAPALVKSYAAFLCLARLQNAQSNFKTEFRGGWKQLPSYLNNMKGYGHGGGWDDKLRYQVVLPTAR